MLRLCMRQKLGDCKNESQVLEGADPTTHEIPTKEDHEDLYEVQTYEEWLSILEDPNDTTFIDQLNEKYDIVIEPRTLDNTLKTLCTLKVT